ncbi:MAG TPA: amidase [Acidimicrobiia bacterium]|nr:amidase [Acidimicrobiia bacterium]
MTATDVVLAVTSGSRRAIDVIDEALARAEAAADLNAFTLIDHEGARAAASRVDEAVRAGRDPGPLAGVPVAVKDLIDQRGLPTTCGSSFYREVPDRSATVVDRLEAAGAVIVGRTLLHEFAYGFSSENDWFGPVRNPIDPATSPGGSSGGSAAAVAAGIVPIAIGTDTGGSVRVPAALCGLVGLKVTHGRIPLTGVFPLESSVDTVGPITATVGDAVLAYAAMAGHHPDDPWSADYPVETPEPGTDLDGVTIGVPHPWVERPLEAGVADGWLLARAALTDLGATVRQIDVPDFGGSPIPLGVWAGAAEVHRAWFEADPSAYGTEVRERLEAIMALTDADRATALEWRDHMRRAATACFEEVDLLATPTTATRRKVIGESLVDAGSEPEPYRLALSWFCSLVNQIGAPALTIPIGAAGKPPPSLQLIAPWWHESRLLGVGMIVERALVP